jgi:hypothetical protein
LKTLWAAPLGLGDLLYIRLEGVYLDYPFSKRAILGPSQTGVTVPLRIEKEEKNYQ